MSEVRLIDANALKEEIRREVVENRVGVFVAKRILKLIDNAPTVEEVSIIEFKEPLPPVKAQKIIRALNERPQGEWIDPQNVGVNNWCSVCGEFILHYNGICNYCPNCGAAMKNQEVQE